MSKNRDSRVATDGGDSLKSNPFASLGLSGLPEAALPAKSSSETGNAKPRGRGRIEIRREKSGRGGKTVTVASGFVGISEQEKTVLAKAIQKRCGVGGAVKNGAIEIQGDKREEVAAELEAAGFRPVFAGG